jgi:proline dehydrogenase
MPLLDFENTGVAFEDKSDEELQVARLLFRQMSRFINSPFASFISTLMPAFWKIHFPGVRHRVKVAFRHFCGGETLDECRAIVSLLASKNVNTTLDHSVESLKTEAALDESRDEIIRTIDEARTNARIPFCVFKVTGIARKALLEKLGGGKSLSSREGEEYQRALDRINKICSDAFEKNVRVLIDAEESWIQDPIDKAAESMMERYNTKAAVVFNTFQMYRIDSFDRLGAFWQRAKGGSYFLGVKLVRGAYLEGENARAEKMKYLSPIHKTKSETHRAYDNALEFCVANRDTIHLYAGTHNQKSVQLLVDLIEKNNIEKGYDGIDIAQLYGMGDNLTHVLSREGYRVSKFVPYGRIERVVPYLIRRAKENSAVRGEIGRELRLIVREIERRRLAKNRKEITN